MIKISDQKFSLIQIAHGEQLLLTDCRPIKDFVDGKPTEKISGFRYTCVCPANKYEQIVVKVEQNTPIITSDELEAKGGTVKCKLKGFEGRFYKDRNNEYQFTARAESIEVQP